MKSKINISTIILSLGIILFTSCSDNSEKVLYNTEKVQIEETIIEIVKKIEASGNNRDLEAVFEYFSEDSDFTFSEDGYMLPPKDSLFRYMKPMYDGLSEVSVNWDSIRVSVTNKESAVFTGSGPWYVKDLAGNTIKGHLVTLYAFKKTEAGWKIIHGHTSHVYY